MSLGRGKRGRLFWAGFTKDDTFFVGFVDELCRAYKKGYSVIELVRLLDQSSARKVYDLLRDNGAIPVLQRKRQPRYEVHELFKNALEKADLSFAQWCNSHSLNPEDAEFALREPLDPEDVPSMPAHNALKNDWPQMYDRIYHPEIAVTCEFSPPKKPGLQNKDKVIIEYRDDVTGFVAFVEEKPVLSGTGDTREAALVALKARYVLIQSTAKLRLLPKHPAPAFKPSWYD